MHTIDICYFDIGITAAYVKACSHCITFTLLFIAPFNARTAKSTFPLFPNIFQKTAQIKNLADVALPEVVRCQ